MSVECATRPSPLDIVTFLPYACDQLLAPFRLSTRLLTVEDYVSKHDDKAKKTKRDKEPEQNQLMSTQRPSDKQDSTSHTDLCDDNEVVVTLVCDTAGRLVELSFHRCTQIPRLLMKIIALCVPFQRMLSKITVRWGPLEGVVLYEMAKILPQSHITDIRLDDSPVPARNYYVLLEQAQLRSLSLARCDLDDEDCIVIASKLRHPEPASRSLSLLCLACNAISDAGAVALGKMLRTNRTLRHLNLCGNRISDDGAADIFRSLARFHLTPDEITAKRKRLFDYLRLKEIIYTKCYNELVAASVDRSPEKSPADKSGAKRKLTNRSKRSSAVALTLASKSATESAMAVRAETMTAAVLGPLVEPYRSEETQHDDGSLYSRGNLTLCYLNMAYNDLEYASIVLLENVLRYQSGLPPTAEPGLLRVVLDGNRVPPSELVALDELQALALTAREPPEAIPRRSERAKSRAR